MVASHPRSPMPSPATDQLLSAVDVTKVFAIQQGFATHSFMAVDHTSFALDSTKPEIFTIAGESGIGKTTLARMILAMEKPTSGALCYKGRSIADMNPGQRRAWFYKEVQPVLQDPFAAFSPLKQIDHYLYETVYN